MEKRKLPKSEESQESALHVFKDFLVLDSYESTKYTPKMKGAKLSKISKPISLDEKSFKMVTKLKQFDELPARRDPEKTKRAIEKDKFDKTTEDIVQKLESGLVPPGMEIEISTKPDSAESLEKVSVKSLSPCTQKFMNSYNIEHDIIDREHKTYNAFRSFNQSPSLKIEEMYLPPQFPKSPSDVDEINLSVEYKKHYRTSKSPFKKHYRTSKSPFKPIWKQKKSRLPHKRSLSPQKWSKSPKRFPEISKQHIKSPEISQNRSRSPRKYTKTSYYSRSPQRYNRSLLRGSEDTYEFPPSASKKARQRSTERFIKELIKTSGIQDKNITDNTNVFHNYPPPSVFPPYTPSAEPAMPVMGNIDGNVYASNVNPFDQYPLPFPPTVPLDIHSLHILPTYEPGLHRFPPVVASSSSTDTFNQNDSNPLLNLQGFPPKDVTAQLIENASEKASRPVKNLALRNEIISACREAVKKLENLHYPNHLILPPGENDILMKDQLAYQSPLHRMRSPIYSFTSKPDSAQAILLLSIASTLGRQISSKSFPSAVSNLRQNMKNASVQTDNYECDKCVVQNHCKLNKQTMTSFSNVSIMTQVDDQDLFKSSIKFGSNKGPQSKEAPVSLMHMTPAQMLVAELAAKAVSFQRSAVEAMKAKQNANATSSSNTKSNVATDVVLSPKTDQEKSERSSKHVSTKPSHGGREWDFKSASQLNREYKDFIKTIDNESRFRRDQNPVAKRNFNLDQSANVNQNINYNQVPNFDSNPAYGQNSNYRQNSGYNRDLDCNPNSNSHQNPNLNLNQKPYSNQYHNNYL